MLAKGDDRRLCHHPVSGERQGVHDSSSHLHTTPPDDSCGRHLMACVMHKVAVVTHSRSSAKPGSLKPKPGLVLGLSPWVRSGFEYPWDGYLDPVFYLLLL